MSSGFSQIRLYQNTSSTIPVGVYTDVTNDFILSADVTNVVEDVSYDYDGCNKTVSGLSPGTQYWFWVEAIDEAGNSSGIQSLGSITTASSVPAEYLPNTGKDRYVIEFTNLCYAGVVNGWDDWAGSYQAPISQGGTAPIGVSSATFISSSHTLSPAIPFGGYVAGWYPPNSKIIWEVDTGAPWTGIRFGFYQEQYRGGVKISRNGVVLYDDTGIQLTGTANNYTATISWG